MKINPYNFILLLGSISIVFYSISYLFKEKGKTQKYFYLFLTTSSLVIIQVLFIDLGLTKAHPWLLSFFVPFQFLSPVYFTAFTSYYLDKPEIYCTNKRNLWIPFIVFLTTYTIIKINIVLGYSFISREAVSFVINELDENLALLFCLLLSIWNYRIIQAYEGSIEELSFFYVRKKTKWIKRVFLSLVILSGIWLFTITLFYTNEKINGHVPYYPVWFLFLIFYYFFLFIGKKHLDVTSGTINNWKTPLQQKILDLQLSGLEKYFSEKELLYIRTNPTQTLKVFSYFATLAIDRKKENHTYAKIIKNCVSQTGIDFCRIYKTDHNSSIICNNGSKFQSELVMLENKQIIRQTMKSKNYVFVENSYGKSKLSIPIYNQQKITAVLYIEDTTKTNLTSESIVLFTLIAKLIEIKLYTAHKVTTIKKIDFINIENKYFKQLNSLLREEKIYFDETLDLESLSNRLSISSSYLSQLINKIEGCNFSDLINRMRVEEVKQRLKDPTYENYTILGIAFECGFKSKSPFYNAFKKHTGFSPKEYRKLSESLS